LLLFPFRVFSFLLLLLLFHGLKQKTSSSSSSSSSNSSLSSSSSNSKSAGIIFRVFQSDEGVTLVPIKPTTTTAELSEVVARKRGGLLPLVVVATAGGL
jgi:hypothetical protein